MFKKIIKQHFSFMKVVWV